MDTEERSRLYPDRGIQKSFFERTTVEKSLLIVVIVLLTIGIGLTISIVNLKKSNNEILKNWKESPKQADLCLTPSCISEASNLINSMDLSVDPCTDFYSFVCGNWIKNNYLITSLESQFTKLSKIIILRAKEILEELQTEKNLPSNKQKVANFYKACMNKVHRNELGAEELVSDLKKFGGWPLLKEDWNSSDFNWADLMIQLFKNGYISNMLFTVKVDVDAKNTSTSLLSVSQPSLGLTNRLYYILLKDIFTKSYKEVIFKLAQLLRGDVNKERRMKDIEEAFEIENKIARMMKDVNMRYPDDFYNIFTLVELESFAPKIPWRKIFTNFLPPDTSIGDSERIMLTSPSYIESLNNILKETENENGRKALANYMFYRVVVNAANYLSKDYSSLISELFEIVTIVPAMPWEVCAKTTYSLLPLSLTASYVNRYTDNSTKEVLGAMVQDIRNSLTDSIRESTWLDEETKNYALWKVEKMKAAIGYQEEIIKDDNLDRYYENVKITDDHFGNIKEMIAFRLRQSMKGLHEKRIRFRWSEEDNLLTANAYYRPAENTIIIPVGVLQDTVFAAGRPNYINYGSLGMIVGHELTHAFDSIGSLYDAEGSYRMWWSNSSWKRFEDKMKCYENQYNIYYVPIANTYINGTLTLAENVADNGGLKAAYYAYNSLLKRIGSEKSLPGLKYNERQMFWISFASVWCRKQTDESIQYAMTHSVHTPSQFRIIGSLSNIKEFSEDFKCKSNSTMNPESKCSLWK